MSIIKKVKLLLFFKSSIYNSIINNVVDKKILANPESLWRGDKKNGVKILDGFINYQKETVYIGKKIWGKNHGSQLWRCYLNSYMWVRDIRAVGTNKARIFLRKKLTEWLDYSDYLDESVWSTEVLSKRIFYLLTNLSFFFDTANEEFQINFSENINKQCILLFNRTKKQKNVLDDIFVIKAILLSTLCFRNLEKNYQLTVNLLKKIIEKKTLTDGMHYLRSPSEHFFFLCSLIDIRNFLGGQKKDIPSELNQKIREMINVLKFFRIGDGHLAIFNKYDFINIKKIDNVLKKVSHSIKLPKLSECSGFFRISKKKFTFIMDCGNPTQEKTHAGSLSFELSHLSEKIVVNSGSPFIRNQSLIDAMRSTAAHSTLNINEINSSDIFFDKDTTTRIANVQSKKYEQDDNIWIHSIHTGYEKIFGYLHQRIIHIDLNNLIMRGEDSFINKGNKKKI